MRCNNCGVEIGDNNICPLCQMIVDGTVVEIKNEYPPKQEKRPLPLKVSPKNIYLIVALIASIISIIVCYMTASTTLWCWFMVAVFAYGYLLIGNTIYSNSEIGAKIFLQGACLISLCYIYEANFKTNVATSYCLPIIITFMIIISGAMLTIFYKHNKSLFVSCNFISLTGFLPIILYACNITTILVPAVISAIVGGITIICNLTFGIKKLKEQFSKVFHL